jgi:cyclohexadienyl dehydratase
VYPKMIALGWVVLFLLEASTAWANPPARLKQIEASKTLRVCIWPDYYGISFRNPKTQQLAGIDIDNARELAKELGSEVKFVDSSFAKLVDDVTADKCDIAMFAVGITPQRQEKLRFTQPHLVSDITPSPPKATAASSSGPTWTSPVTCWRWPKARCTKRS